MNKKLRWFADAPSNIALIKYMGKKDATINLADNPSLSYTLPHLFSSVCLELTDHHEDIWRPWDDLSFEGDADNSLILSLKGQTRFLNHFKKIKQHLDYQGNFIVYSKNNFPEGRGIASSASSFAALTRCAISAISELTNTSPMSTLDQALFSRLGSGSSCRSFYAPWCVWHDQEVYAIELPFSDLKHQAIVFESQEKKISSSEAHQRVPSSRFYEKRAERATQRFHELLQAFKLKDWYKIYQLSFDEFMDMHQLFETAHPAFSYRLPASNELINQLQTYWTKHHDGPLITMDAGSTIHLLYRQDQLDLADEFKRTILSSYHVF